VRGKKLNRHAASSGANSAVSSVVYYTVTVSVSKSRSKPIRVKIRSPVPLPGTSYNERQWNAPHHILLINRTIPSIYGVRLCIPGDS